MGIPPQVSRAADPGVSDQVGALSGLPLKVYGTLVLRLPATNAVFFLH